jgi:hypothetical protein
VKVGDAWLLIHRGRGARAALLPRRHAERGNEIAPNATRVFEFCWRVVAWERRQAASLPAKRARERQQRPGVYAVSFDPLTVVQTQRTS